jgi:hypothetical protein
MLYPSRPRPRTAFWTFAISDQPASLGEIVV